MEPGLTAGSFTAGSPAVWQTKFGRGLNFKKLAVAVRLKCLIFRFV